MLKGLGAQRMLALFAGGWLLFNYPLLGLLDLEGHWFGVPAFPAALFLIWALLIALLAWLVEGKSPSGAADPATGTPPAAARPAAPTAPPSRPTEPVDPR